METMATAVQERSLPDVVLDNDLFPLPLTAFERYMVVDDHVDYPMTFAIEILLSGDFRDSEFNISLNHAIQRHPLLRANIARLQGKLCWIQCENSIVFSVQNEFDPPPETAKPSINLRKQAGVRTTVLRDGEMTRVSFLFHHAATDGIGAMRMIGDLLGYYGQLTVEEGEDAPEHSPLHNDVLTKRGQIWSPDAVPDRSWKRTLKHLVEYLKCFPAGIATGANSQFTVSILSPFVSRTLKRKPFLEVKNAAKKHGVNPNDIYLACTYSTIKEWNSTFKKSVDKEQYRVLIPSSLRTPEHDEMPAANVLSFVLISTSAASTNEPIKLVKNLSQRMQAILNTADSRLFTRMFQVAGKIPRGMTFLTQSPVRVCTSVLANVGEVKRQLNCRFPTRRGKCVAGSVVLEGLFGAAPIRKGTAVGISLGSYAGELLINFNCDPKQFSSEQAEQFAELFLIQLNQYTTQMNQEI